jgi:hypothetical protein
MLWPSHACAAANPAIALRLHSTRPVGRVAELGSLGFLSSARVELYVSEGVQDVSGAAMEDSIPRPDTVNKLRSAADAAFAMLAGMQLDVFTPLKAGPMTAHQIATAIGVAPTRLPLLLYSLVVAGLLTEQDGRFSNTPEANQFLVKGDPSYIGNRHALIASGGLIISKPLNRFAQEYRRQSWIFPMLRKRN